MDPIWLWTVVLKPSDWHFVLSWFMKPGETIFGGTRWTWLRPQGHCMSTYTCDLHPLDGSNSHHHGINDQMHTMLCHLFYCKWDHDLQNEHYVVATDGDLKLRLIFARLPSAVHWREYRFESVPHSLHFMGTASFLCIIKENKSIYSTNH